MKLWQNLFNCVRILIVSLSHALPFSVDFQQQQHVGEVDRAAPTFFEHAHYGESLLQGKHVDSGLEILACAHGVHIVVKLLNAAALKLAVEESKQTGVLCEKFLGIFAVALCHTSFISLPPSRILAQR